MRGVACLREKHGNFSATYFVLVRAIDTILRGALLRASGIIPVAGKVKGLFCEENINHHHSRTVNADITGGCRRSDG